VVRALRENGHDVLAVCEIAKRMQDSEVIDLSTRKGRILITEDKDLVNSCMHMDMVPVGLSSYATLPLPAEGFAVMS
jgi:predicted nuclease of predicted toxin-antitoxin system